MKPGPYQTGEAPLPSRVTCRAVADDAAAGARDSRFADGCGAFEDILAARAVAEGEYAAPLPLDGAASESDRRLKDDLAANDRRLEEATARLAEAAKSRDARRAALLPLPKPAPPALHAAAVAAMVLLAAGVAACGGVILAPTLEPALNAFYVLRLGGGGDRLSLAAAHLVASGLFLMLCLAHLAVVLGARGDVGWKAAAAALALDALFAAAWGLQRLPEGGGASGTPSPRWHLAASVTLLEAVAALLFALALVGLSRFLKRNAPKADAWRGAREASREADRAHAEALAERAEAAAVRLRLLEAVAAREAAARRAEDRRRLLDLTARAGYATAVSAMAHAAAEDPGADACADAVDGHLAGRAKPPGEAPKKRSLPW